MNSILLAALLSSVLTTTIILLVIWALVRYRWLPRIQTWLDTEMQEKVDEASDTLSRRIEAAVRKGVMDGVSSLPSREVLKGTTRTLARTGREYVETGLNSILGRRRDREDED